VSLPIQKLATKNCVPVDSEMDSDGGVILGFNLPFFGCLHPRPSGCTCKAIQLPKLAIHNGV
jgi:hypothetical protein